MEESKRPRFSLTLHDVKTILLGITGMLALTGASYLFRQLKILIRPAPLWYTIFAIGVGILTAILAHVIQTLWMRQVPRPFLRRWGSLLLGLGVAMTIFGAFSIISPCRPPGCGPYYVTLETENDDIVKMCCVRYASNGTVNCDVAQRGNQRYLQITLSLAPKREESIDSRLIIPHESGVIFLPSPSRLLDLSESHVLVKLTPSSDFEWGNLGIGLKDIYSREVKVCANHNAVSRETVGNAVCLRINPTLLVDSAYMSDFKLGEVRGLVLFTNDYLVADHVDREVSFEIGPMRMEEQNP